MSNFIEQVKETLCDFCAPEYCVNINKPEACTREITALEIVKLAELIQEELDKKEEETVRYRFI